MVCWPRKQVSNSEEVKAERRRSRKEVVNFMIRNYCDEVVYDRAACGYDVSSVSCVVEAMMGDHGALG